MCTNTPDGLLAVPNKQNCLDLCETVRDYISDTRWELGKPALSLKSRLRTFPDRPLVFVRSPRGRRHLVEDWSSISRRSRLLIPLLSLLDFFTLYLPSISSPSAQPNTSFILYPYLVPYSSTFSTGFPSFFLSSLGSRHPFKLATPLDSAFPARTPLVGKTGSTTI
jgi:hypothetical protein